MFSLISVVICTYNRADLLSDVLQTVCEQTLQPSEYEVIVVDNNSTDSTREVTESFVARYANVRYCLEAQQGLSHARNRGWQEAKGEIVAYIDDDVKVPPEWLMVAKEVIKNVSPDVLSGPSFAFYNTPKPYWFKDAYGSHEPYGEAGIPEHPEDIYGHNLFFRRELLAQSGGFDPNLGMNGEQIGYGEETALLRHIHATLPATRFYYEPRLFLYHLVRPEKMTWRWIVAALFAKGRDFYSVCPPPNLKLRWLGRVVKYTFLLLFSVPFALLFRDRKQYPYLENYLYEVASSYLHTLGQLYEQSRQLILRQSSNS